MRDKKHQPVFTRLGLERQWLLESGAMKTITVEIPDNLAGLLSAGGNDLSRTALEAMALEGYRTEQLTESDLKELLGFETRMEVHGFLKDHGACIHYSVEDLDHETESALEVARRHRAQKGGSPPEQHA